MTAASVPSVTVSKNTREVPQLATMSYLRPSVLSIRPGQSSEMLVRTTMNSVAITQSHRPKAPPGTR